ncbi:MAG: methyltransferase domain-containing protein [Bacteroidia bacterium]
MKLHRPLVNAIVEILNEIFFAGIYADKAIEQALKKNTRWGARDRRFVAENVYEMVRWWRKLNVVLNNNENIQTNIHLLFAVHLIIKGIDIPEWDEFSGIDKEEILKKLQEIDSIRKYKESIPDWLDTIGVQELGEGPWTREIHELNKEADVVIRANSIKTKPEQLQQNLISKGIETKVIQNENKIWQQIKNNAFVIKRQNLVQLDEYKKGLFEIQDASSQLVAPFMRLEAGMTVIDACAGAGGKSLHMAAIMQNKGKIISMDIGERKLIELQKRAERAGASCIQTQVIKSNTIEQLKNTADRLLLDVPCSGLGVLKRNPDAKWKLSAEFIEEIKKTQQDIISNYSQMLKPGGIMVYATCSILPSENQNQVETFLNKKKGEFEFIEDKKIMPSDGFDGFYMAAIRKL